MTDKVHYGFNARRAEQIAADKANRKLIKQARDKRKLVTLVPNPPKE